METAKIGIVGCGNISDTRSGAQQWSEIPHTHGHADTARSIGVADMAYALRSGRAHRASGELAYHVLDMMVATGEASESSRHVEIASPCPRPQPLPLGLRDGRLDE